MSHFIFLFVAILQGQFPGTTALGIVVLQSLLQPASGMLEGSSSDHSGVDALLQAATLTGAFACVATATAFTVPNIYEEDHEVPKDLRFPSMTTGKRIEFRRGRAQGGTRPAVQGTIVALSKNSVLVKFPQETGRSSVKIQKDRLEIDFIRELSEGEPFAEQIFEVRPRLPAPSMHLRPRSEPLAPPIEVPPDVDEDKNDRSLLPLFSSLGLPAASMHWRPRSEPDAPLTEAPSDDDEADENDRSLLPLFSSLRLGDRLEFWTGYKSSRVLHRGSIVTLYPNSVALEYQEDDTASREGARRTQRISSNYYSSRVRRRLSSSEEAAESTETRPASHYHDHRAAAGADDEGDDGNVHADDHADVEHDGHVEGEDGHEASDRDDDDHDAAADDDREDDDGTTDRAFDCDDEEAVLNHGIKDASDIEVTLDDSEPGAAGLLSINALKIPVSSGALEQGARFMSEVFETAERASQSRTFYDFPVLVSEHPLFCLSILPV
jgi:hypothetical protein